MHVLFVCHANMCRSPLAEALGRKLAAEREMPERMVFRSAGLWAADDHGAVPEAIAAAAEYGADLEEHVTTPFCLAVADRADYIVAMTRSQKGDIVTRLPMLRARVYTFAEWVHEMTGRRPRWRDVADPVGGTREQFRKCARLLHDSLASVFDVMCGAAPRRRGVLTRMFS